jgi:large subunit ribosomal protein L1
MKKRSKRFKELKKKIEPRFYLLDEALNLIKETSNIKFDASVEVHVKLGLDLAKSDQQVRGTLILPNPIGKKIRIAAFVTEAKQDEVKKAGADVVGGEDLVKKIKETEKCDFDVAIAEPSMMRYLGRIGKILGTKGLMPNPKTDTVTSDPVKTIKELKAGKISFKADPSGVVHQVIGKVSSDPKKLKENYVALFEVIKKNRPAKIKGEYIKSITLCSTMGPGIKVK